MCWLEFRSCEEESTEVSADRPGTKRSLVQLISASTVVQVSDSLSTPILCPVCWLNCQSYCALQISEPCTVWSSSKQFGVRSCKSFEDTLYFCLLELNLLTFEFLEVRALACEFFLRIIGLGRQICWAPEDAVVSVCCMFSDLLVFSFVISFVWHTMMG